MQSIIDLSVTSLAEAIRNKEISSTEAMDSYLRRIEAVNPKLNARGATVRTGRARPGP